MRSKLVVNEAAESMNLTVLETVKAELNITTDDHDEVLEGLICQASGIVADYCDRVFAQETVTESFWPERRSWYEYWDSLVLSRTPISEIISVTHDNFVLTTEDYEVDTKAGILYRMTTPFTVFDWHVHSAVEVQYTGGYLLLDDLPYGIEKATILLVKDYHFQRNRDPRIKTESTPSIYSVDYWVGSTGPAGELPPDVVALLTPYRRLTA